MTLTHINLLLAVLLAIVVGLVVATNVDYSQPNFEFLPEMKRSAASGAFEANKVFPNGRTLQTPVPGTIARGELPLYYTATKEDALRAGVELRNPFAFSDASTATPNSSDDESRQPDASQEQEAAIDEQQQDSQSAQREADALARLNASIQRGAQVYGVFCVSCHGPSGAGDGSVAKRGFPPPPPLTTGKSVEMKDGQLFHILTYGQGSMSPLAAQLNRDRRWDAINYVRSLQVSAAKSQNQAAPSPPDSPAGLEASKPSPNEEGQP